MTTNQPPKLPAIVPALSRLTVREREVLALVAQGCKNREIAERLQLTESTIRHHLSDLYHKVGLTDRLELVVFAGQHDLLAENA